MYVNVIYILRMRWRWGGSVQIVGHRLRWSRVEGSAHDLVLFVGAYLLAIQVYCAAWQLNIEIPWTLTHAASIDFHKKKLEEEQQSQQKHSFVKLHILQALRGGSISRLIIGYKFNFKDWLLGKPDHKLIFKTRIFVALGSNYGNWKCILLSVTSKCSHNWSELLHTILPLNTVYLFTD